MWVWPASYRSLLIALLCFATVGCGRSEYTNIDECLEARGLPVVVSSGYRLERKKRFRTVTLFGLKESQLASLKASQDRWLVYTRHNRFTKSINLHFENLLEPKVRTGSTMFSANYFAPTLEIIHFGPDGRFIDEERIKVDLAWFEEGTPENLVRIKPARY